jgi:nucleoside-diphosphate-sugar epimerase
LRVFKLQGGNRVLAAGTCAEYDGRFGYCSERVTPVAPSTLYGVCKNALKEILMAFADQEGLSAAWGRVFFLYGPHEHPTRLVPSVINALLDGQPALCTHGNQIRDFLHVEDVASAFAALLDSEIEGAVNIASGEPVALKNIIYRIAEKLEQPDLVQLGAIPASESDVPLLIGDASPLKQEVGWAPHYNLDTGLEMTIDWWKRQKQL